MTFAVAAHSQKRVTGIDVTLNGAPMPDVLSFSASTSRSQRNSECTIQAASMPLINPGDDVVVTVRINGEEATAFRGDYYDGGWSYDGGKTFELSCRGALARLNMPWQGPDRVYGYVLTDAECSAAAVKRNLIEAMGIPPDRHTIPEPVLLDEGGTPGMWLLGRFQLVWAKAGEPLMHLLEEIDRVTGWATYDDLDGEIRSTEYAPSGAEATALYIFQQGVNGVRISRKRTVSHGIINKWYVKGRTVFDVPVESEIHDTSAIIDAYWPPEKRPAYNEDTFQSDLIETPNHAFRVAERLLSYTNRPVDGFTLELEVARPDLKLGDTIGLVYAGVNVPGGARVMIERIQISGDAATGKTSMTIETNGGTLV